MSGRAGPALLVLALALLAGCSSDAPRNQGHRLLLGDRDRDSLREEERRADPSRVIAAELAFARLAQEKGQWTAFIETSTDDAVMFVPEPVNAREWLRKQTNPPQAVRWQPHQVWSSCDGTLAVTRGASQWPNGSVGYFTTVWERQRGGGYKWVMDQGDVLAQPLEAPEMVGATVADCDTSRLSETMPPLLRLIGELRQGGSRDGTLKWLVNVRPDGSRSVLAEYWDGTGWKDAVREIVSAE